MTQPIQAIHGESIPFIALSFVTDLSFTAFIGLLGLLFISLYLLHRQAISTLLFGAFCNLIALHKAIVDLDLLHHIFELSHTLDNQRVGYIALVFSAPLFIYFSEHLYPRYRRQYAAYIITVISSLFALAIGFSPTSIIHPLITGFYITLIPFGIYLTWLTALVVKHHREHATLFTVGYLSFAISICIDALSPFLPFELPKMFDWGILTLVLCQSTLLIKRYINHLTHAKKTTKRLNAKNEQLQKLNEIKDDFLAHTAHELRTPIHAISALTELVLQHENKIDDRSLQHLKLILTSSDRLSHLVNDILDLSSIEHNQIKLHPTAFPLSPLLDSVTNSLRPLLKGRPITLSYDLPPELPKVLADEDRIQQILFNLIGNAIKFTLEGRIVVRAECEGNQIMITVSDTGLGIDNTIINELFQPYKQGQQQTPLKKGHGLGLTITRNLLACHNSQLNIKSIPGHGSTFSFALDAATHIPDSIISITSPEPSSAHERSTDPRANSNNETQHRQNQHQDQHAFQIWAVDDELLNLQILENQIQDMAYHCIAFSSGIDILEALSTHEPPDLILIDAKMPLMNGFELCARIRRSFETLELPILIITESHQTQDIQMGFTVGANDYLTKPYTAETLNVRITRQLSKMMKHHKMHDNEDLLAEIYQRQQLEYLITQLQQQQPNDTISLPQQATSLNDGLDSPTVLTARQQIVTAIRLVLTVWQKRTGSNMTTFAEHSGLWRVYMDNGRLQTRTLHQYINEKTLPQKPRWRLVIESLEYCLNRCSVTEKEEIQMKHFIDSIAKQPLN